MGNFETRIDGNGQAIVKITVSSEVSYTTLPFPTEAAAISAAKDWLRWFTNLPYGKAESIYYILVVPETWSGAAQGAHPYSGLHFKIGRTKNVLRRVQQLQTGTSGELIIHA